MDSYRKSFFKKAFLIDFQTAFRLGYSESLFLIVQLFSDHNLRSCFCFNRCSVNFEQRLWYIFGPILNCLPRIAQIESIEAEHYSTVERLWIRREGTPELFFARKVLWLKVRPLKWSLDSLYFYDIEKLRAARSLPRAALYRQPWRVVYVVILTWAWLSHLETMKKIVLFSKKRLLIFFF